MKWKIKPIKENKYFAIFPLHCEKCLTAHWLRFVKSIYNDCFCDCGGQLWQVKDYAIEKYDKYHK